MAKTTRMENAVGLLPSRDFAFAMASGVTLEPLRMRGTSMRRSSPEIRQMEVTAHACWHAAECLKSKKQHRF